jgi:hypothetical protein
MCRQKSTSVKFVGKVIRPVDQATAQQKTGKRKPKPAGKKTKSETTAQRLLKSGLLRLEFQIDIS